MKSISLLAIASLTIAASACASVTVDGETEGDGDGDRQLPSSGGANIVTPMGGAPGAGGGLIGGPSGGTTGNTGGGSSTGGSAATGGGTSTGGGSGTADCPALVCGGAGTTISGAMCFTVTLGEYGGWMVNSGDGCSITVDGSPGTSGQTLSAGPHEIEVSGCMHAYAAIQCY